MDRVRRLLEGMHQATRRAVVTAGMGCLLAAGGVVVAGAFAYAIAAAVAAPDRADDPDDSRRAGNVGGDRVRGV